MKQIALCTSFILAGLLAACLQTPSTSFRLPQSAESSGATLQPQGAYSNCANHAQLSIAYIKEGDIWLWVEGGGTRQLTADGDARDLRISDDGCRVAYAREVANPNYDPEELDEYEQRLRELEELWMVFSDGTGQQQLVSVEQFPPPVMEGDFMDTTLSSFEWQPGALTIAFGTASVFRGPGPFPHQDVHLVDTETLAITTLLSVGQGGRFVFSPDGKQLAFADIDRAGLLNVDGTGLRNNFFVFPWIVPSAHRAYQPLLNWTPAGDLIFALPPGEMSAEPHPDTILWYLPLDGAPAFEAGAIQAVHALIPEEVAFSPDRRRIAYLRSVGDPRENRQELVIALSNGGEESASFNYSQILFGDWAPDNQRFIYSYYENGLHLLIANLDGSLETTVAMPYPARSHGAGLNWVGDELIVASWDNELYLIRVNGSVELIDTRVWQVDVKVTQNVEAVITPRATATKFVAGQTQIASAPMPSSTPSGPIISSFTFCDKNCSLPGARTVTSYQGYTENIWLSFKFQGMQRGMRYVREWWADGDLWIRVHCTWQGGESGSLDVRLYDQDGGLYGGTWELRLIIEDSFEFTSSILVNDHNRFWDPVGNSHNCPDW